MTMSNCEIVIDLIQRLPENASFHEIAREIEFVAELPKTTSGKTRHFELRQAGMRSLVAAAAQTVAPC